MRRALSMQWQLVLIVLLVGMLSGGLFAQTNLGRVSVEGVTNSLAGTSLQAGSTHYLSIRYDFTALPSGWWNSSNTFELYSPDGANWVNLTRANGPLVTGLPPTVMKFYSYYTSADNGITYTRTAMGGSTQPGGSTGPNSRVAASLAVVTQVPGTDGFAGGAGGANGIALTLQFQTRLADVGKTICVDTANAGGTVSWEWATDGLTDHPVWDNGLGVDGPRCWVIGSCPNLPPQWCNGNVGNLNLQYCRGGSYQLCAGNEVCWPDVTYRLAPPYDNGNFGSVNSQTGLWTWSGPTVPPSAFLDVQFQVLESGTPSYELFTLHVVVNDIGCDCCVGQVGDANGSGEDEPTVGDISVLIDYLFISGAWINCLEEADVNQSGGENPTAIDITISDVSVLVDHLFISRAALRTAARPLPLERQPDPQGPGGRRKSRAETA